MMNHRIWVYHCFFPCFFTNPTCYSLYFKWVLSRLLLTPLLDHHVTQRGVFPRIPHPNIKDRILKIFPKSASLGVGKKKKLPKFPDILRVEPAFFEHQKPVRLDGRKVENDGWIPMIVALVRDEDGTCTMFEFLALPRRTLLHGTCLLIYIYIILYIYVYSNI